jgi:hypothetical protein
MPLRSLRRAATAYVGAGALALTVGILLPKPLRAAQPIASDALVFHPGLTRIGPTAADRTMICRQLIGLSSKEESLLFLKKKKQKDF